MYFERLKKVFSESNLTYKKLAELSRVSEKTIKRMLTSSEYHADLYTIERVTAALNITMQELFSETDVVLIRKDVLAELEEAKQFVEECKGLATENIELRGKITSLTKTNDLLQSKLEQKEEIISIHESYKVLLFDLARIINENHTDTQ